MGKVLLIEPQGILRHALSLSLFSDHEVQSEESINATLANSLSRYDLLVIDAAALREARQLTSQVIRSVQSCKTPVLWLDDNQAPDPPKRQKLEVVTRPIEREAFQSALEALLTGKSRPKGRASAEAKAGAGGEKVKEKKKASTKQSTEEPIDLFDVVEEGRKPAKPKRGSRRKKR
jgi:hypothetical protein